MSEKLPDELLEEVMGVVSSAAQSGKVRRGVNETTKSVERKNAKLVVIADDVDPPEIVAHLPPLCQKMGVPYVSVPSKADLGKAAGIEVPASSVAVEDPGAAKERLEALLKRLPKVKSSEGS